MRWIVAVALAAGLAGDVRAQRPRFDAFEVATIKVSDENEKGRYIRMVNDHRFLEKDYTVKGMIAAAYDLNAKTISGGPAWLESAHYDIEAVTPGAVRPTHEEQMRMLRSLLEERFGLKFHREQKEFAIYTVEVARGGSKLKITSTPGEPTVMGPGVVYPQKVVLPARNAGVGDLASLLQRAILDRPVVDRTGLKDHFDFDLEWAPNESEFGGDVGKASETAPSPPLFTAMEQELGLKLTPKKGLVDALVVDAVMRPGEN